MLGEFPMKEVPLSCYAGKKKKKSRYLLSRCNKEWFKHYNSKMTQILSKIDEIQKLEPSPENLIFEENLQRELDE